jgi:O-methyltransferase involved in polyketide biosynthesis
MATTFEEADMTTTTLPTFTPLEDSLWVTLCSRALDHRSTRPILGDAAADRIVRTLDYDYRSLSIDSNMRASVALRAKKLDEVTAGFIARHPDAVVLDLGVGLDTRHDRLDVPDTVDWYDVDLPAVVTARERLVPARPNGHVIAADVRTEDWLTAVPTGRPALIVADGLMGFLTKPELVALWNRLISHFPGGELVFNSYSRSVVWMTRHTPGTKSVADLIRFPGMDDPHDAESWNPKLRLVREILLSREPEIAAFPWVWRLYHRLAARSLSWSRWGTIVLHYRF